MSLYAIDTKNLIKFHIRNELYYHALIGDDVINVFDRMLMNICLEQYHDTLHCEVSYDDICFISVTKNRNRSITDLPIQLTELRISRSRCTTFSIPDNTAENLKILFLDYTNLSIVPKIDHCRELTSCTINHSNINSFHEKIPEKLVEFNLRWNVIDSFDFTIALQLQKLDLNNNHFHVYTIIEGNGRTFSYLQQGTYVHNKIGRRNEPVVIENFRPIYAPNPMNVTVTVDLEEKLFNSQSVHLSSVNLSVYNSIIAIKEWVKTNKFIVNNVSIHEIKKYINDVNSIQFLIEKFKENARHTLTRFTYKELFNLVWCVAMNHENKIDIINRIAVEVKDSINMCFTGGINRIVNSLTGILECVSIGISTKEQTQLNVQRIVKKVVENKLEYIDALCEIKNLFTNDSDDESKSWLEAFKDYEPDATNILCRRIVDGVQKYYTHTLTYDNFILDCGHVVGSREEDTGEDVFFSID